jgi:hypothetical protein
MYFVYTAKTGKRVRVFSHTHKSLSFATFVMIIILKTEAEQVSETLCFGYSTMDKTKKGDCSRM